MGGIVIVVRSDDEYSLGHIPGSVNIPVGEARLPVEVPDKFRFLIFYGETGSSGDETSLEIAQHLGYHNVFNLGGLRDWPYEIE